MSQSNSNPTNKTEESYNPIVSEAPSQNNDGPSSLKSYGFPDPIHDDTSVKNSDATSSKNSPKSVSTVSPKPNLNETAGIQEMSHIPKSYNPIVSVEDFFNDDMPLPSHSVEESPCHPIHFTPVRYQQTSYTTANYTQT